MNTPPFAGPVLRIISGLLVAAACFQIGRWTGQLESRAAIDTGNELITAKNGLPPAPVPVEPKPAVAVGEPAGETGDIITPLNVRDPAALVMGPGAGSAYSGSVIPPPEPPSAPSRHKMRTKPLPEGRLLDLMKKQDATPEQPKVY